MSAKHVDAALMVMPPEQRALAARHEMSVEELIGQVAKIQQVMQAVMKKDEHYGVIPGTGKKPTLLKAGAEKLCLLFRLDPEYESVESWDGAHMTVKSRCTLYHIPTGERRGSGEATCSTKEAKYAYRQSKRACPSCGVESIFKSKFPPRNNPRAEPGWYCNAKSGGCGANFDAGDKAIEEQADGGRVPNPDLPDTYNTVLKMANKRSLVAAVLNVTAASDIFTQDLEDLPKPKAYRDMDVEERAEEEAEAKRRVAAHKAKHGEAREEEPPPANDDDPGFIPDDDQGPILDPKVFWAAVRKRAKAIGAPAEDFGRLVLNHHQLPSSRAIPVSAWGELQKTILSAKWNPEDPDSAPGAAPAGA